MGDQKPKVGDSNTPSGMIFFFLSDQGVGRLSFLEKIKISLKYRGHKQHCWGVHEHVDNVLSMVI